MPFLPQYHADDDYVFWPDLASSHAKDTVALFRDQNIHFVPKDENPPNVPQVRPMGYFKVRYMMAAGQRKRSITRSGISRNVYENLTGQ
jgi:hypothetical protein